METVYLGFQAAYIVCVVDDIVGLLKSRGSVDLCGNDILHVVFTYIIALHGALDLILNAGIDHQDAINRILSMRFEQ